MLTRHHTPVLAPQADESASDDTLLAVKQEVGSDASSSPSLSASGVVAGPAAGAVSGMEAASSAEMDDVIMQQVELAGEAGWWGFGRRYARVGG